MRYLMKKYLHPDGEAGATPPVKTFTQEEVNRMMADEKRQGRASVLKDLGVEDEAAAKDALSKYQANIEAQKTELQKAQDATAAEKQARALAEQQAVQLNNKLAALTKGVKPEFLEDALAIAATKVTNKEDLGKVLDGMKERYAMFFSGTEQPNAPGTGTAPGSKRTGQGEKGIGTRLGEQNAKLVPDKSHYFG